MSEVGLVIGAIFLAAAVVWRLGYTMCWKVVAEAARSKKDTAILPVRR